MKKIRINELARELEVKAHEILERLPELGVTEKKTHSSSIDEDVAIRLRRFYGLDVPDYVPGPDDDVETEAREEHPGETAETLQTSDRKSAATPELPAEPAARMAEDAAAPVAGKPAAEEQTRPGSAPPIRPPLAARPIHPPVGGAAPARPEPARAQVPRTAPGHPPTPPAAVGHPAPAGPGAPAPSAVVAVPGRPAAPAAKPLPVAPRPGQVLSGPRQPFPAAPPAVARPGTQPQRPQVVPGPNLGRKGRVRRDRVRPHACRTTTGPAAGGPTGGQTGGAAPSRSGCETQRPQGTADAPTGSGASSGSSQSAGHAGSRSADLPRPDSPGPAHDHQARCAPYSSWRAPGRTKTAASHFTRPHRTGFGAAAGTTGAWASRR